MSGCPSRVMKNAQFQPLETPCSILRCRSRPTPSGAPVSSMSKKSPLTPAIAWSASTVSSSGAVEAICGRPA